MGKKSGEPKKSSISVSKVVRVDHEAGSAGERKFGKMSE